MKFTPGPWASAARQGDDWNSVVFTQQNSDVEICQCFHERGNKDSCEANANLIAAAPEMYEALKGVLEDNGLADLIAAVGEGDSPFWAKVKAVIAKADGGSL